MDKFFDKYAWQAQRMPALIVLLPVALAFLAWVPKAQDTVKPLIGLASGAGIFFLLAQVARHKGKQSEANLFSKWGGVPSVILLRHRDTTIDANTKRRYHLQLAKIVSDIHMPTAEEEKADLQGADNVYSACSTFLRTHTRDKNKYPLVFTENISYGFRRNLFGIRTIGIILSIAGTAGCIWKLFYDHGKHSEVSPLAVACLLGCIGFVFLWVFFVNPAWVRGAAEAYASRLLESIDTLDVLTKSKKEKTAKASPTKGEAKVK